LENSFVLILKTAFWILFLFAGWSVKEHTELSKPSIKTVHKSPNLEGFSVASFSTDVLKLSNPNELVYIKNIPDFFTPEHSPMICWRGSGYELNKISELDVGSFKCYTAELVQGKQKLYTAWWFSNGEKHTNSQLIWRWQSFRSGTRYCLVNYTVASQQELKPGIIQLLKVKGFRTLLNNSDHGTAISGK
jgi:exosortase N